MALTAIGGRIERPNDIVTALRDGATHLLALRSRPAAHRLPPVGRLAEIALCRTHRDLVPLVTARPQRYNRDADELARLFHRPGAMHWSHRSRYGPGSALSITSAPMWRAS